MSINRSAVSATPLFLRAASRSSRQLPHPLSRRFPAIAILIPHSHPYSTETSTSHGGSSGFPPPGFNTEQAKRPLKKEERQEQQAGEAADAQAAKSTLREEGSPATAGKHEATAHPKTSAEEKQSLAELAADQKAVEKTSSDKQVEKRKEEQKNLTIWQKVKKEANHYWDGTKLLAAETRISFKLALKMAAGYELTRREQRQVSRKLRATLTEEYLLMTTQQFHRTVQDLGRLVPFSVFVLVPFAELLLPVALKLFPNMLPSTYEGQKSKEAKSTRLRSTRKEVSNFLRQTLKETGLPVSAANAQTSEFIDFFRKVRTTGESPSAADVIKVCKIFKDDLTLDNLSRPQLVGMTRYMNLSTFGTDAMLRYQIRHRMRQIKRDDKAISFEGVDSLSVPELQTAAASRGLRTHGLSPARLRDDIQMWLDCRLRYGVPSTLLVLSNAFVYAQGKETELSSQIDALQAVLASVPEELFHEIELEVHTAEGAATNKQRLEVLKEQQELIEEENEQNGEAEGQAAPKDTEDIDEKEDRSAVGEGEGEVMQAKADGEDQAPTDAAGEAREEAEKKAN